MYLIGGNVGLTCLKFDGLGDKNHRTALKSEAVFTTPPKPQEDEIETNFEYNKRSKYPFEQSQARSRCIKSFSLKLQDSIAA